MEARVPHEEVDRYHDKFMDLREETISRISALEAEVEALKPWRDGFDPKVTMPEQGVKVWVAMPYLDTCVYFRALWNVDEWLEVERRSYAWKRDRITRWWPLPEVTK